MKDYNLKRLIEEIIFLLKQHPSNFRMVEVFFVWLLLYTLISMFDMDYWLLMIIIQAIILWLNKKYRDTKKR